MHGVSDLSSHERAHLSGRLCSVLRYSHLGRRLHQEPWRLSRHLRAPQQACLPMQVVVPAAPALSAVKLLKGNMTNLDSRSPLATKILLRQRQAKTNCNQAYP